MIGPTVHLHVTHCSMCPFCNEDPEPYPPSKERVFVCDAGHDVDTGGAHEGYPRVIPAIHGTEPPEWCLLRTADRHISFEPYKAD